MTNSNKKVVTRFAPSPTGFMHVGNLRTALFTYLLAKKNNGTLILRIEDTDKEREVAGATEHILKVLKWVGINWDEGPDIGGPNAPYTQSERLDLYKKYAEKLIEKGLAYPDPYTEEEVEVLRKNAEENKKPFLYREHRPETFEVWDGKKPLRYKVPEIKVSHWHDLVFGDLSAGPEALDDLILIKSNGYPTYNFCHIVDDIEMGITHVVRGQEYISSIPKYLSLYESLGVNPPFFICMPHIMGKNGIKKLGKRDGAKDSMEYKEEGYLSQAMVNFLALLGWHPSDDKELFSMDELKESFDVSRVQKSGAQWNDEKLDWFNREYLKKLSAIEQEEYVEKFIPQSIKELPNYNKGIVNKITPIVLERISCGKNIVEMANNGDLTYFFDKPKYDGNKLIYKDTPKEKIINNLKSVLETISMTSEEDFNKENIKIFLMEFADHLENRGQLLHPMRFALSGMDKSPDPFVLSEILGKNETISRLNEAIRLLKTI